MTGGHKGSEACDARAAMFRAGASRCRRLPWSRGGPRPAPRSWVTPARDFVVSAPEESSSASPSAPRGGSVPDALQPPRGSLRPAILVCTSKVVSAATRKDYEAWLVDGKRLIEEVLRDKDYQLKEISKWQILFSTPRVGRSEVMGFEVRGIIVWNLNFC